ncbi:Gluconolactonase precursor [Gimesia alba]|uniref:Gluconolactonase n=1 Tax=Gimesia alba TaxID=2527973 RepID=A0A517RFJ7_9PLAN|nr:SMP-30/gluconolactonase/LRE family protein [Gimesia alba]QDT42649.1 Gluconolactonase precursor [Gimesia alba]
MQDIQFNFERVWSIEPPGKHLLEGPVLSPDGTRVYFTDCFQGTIYEFDPNQPTVAPTEIYSYAPYCCNGLQFLPNGKLAACLWKGTIWPKGMLHELDLQHKPKPKTELRISHSTTGKQFRHPNDLAVDEAGGVYFTDLRGGHVYYYACGDTQAKSCLELDKPNGIELQMVSGKAQSLYVADSGTSTVLHYEIKSPGVIGKQIANQHFKIKHAVDGLALSSDGLLFVAEKGAVYALDAQLDPIGRAPLMKDDPPIPSNICFIDEKRFVVTSYRSFLCPNKAELFIGTIED